jgi:hypothetical protein
MTFPVVGSNIPSVYQIDNSLRFNEADTSYLSTTFSSAGNRKTFTWSGWIKKGNNDDSGYQSIFTAKAVSNGNDGLFLYQNKISISWDFDDTGQEIRSSAVFRDNSAWYHIVYAVDTTLATASDRIRIYVNGVEVALDSTVGQNEDGGINKNDIHSIGVWNTGTSTNHLFDGYMAECHFIDGQQLSPTDFGEFDEDSGIWKPKQYAGTYGTNGFYLKFNNTGNMGEDSSGNDNTFTPTNLSGTTDVTTDTPTNNWVVVNNLDKGQSNASYMMNLSEGNLKISGEAESSSARASGFIMSAGKWYWEVCLVSAGIFQVVGIDASNSDLTTEGTGLDANSIGYFSHTGLTRRGGTATTSGATWTTTGDIIGIAYDGDNGTLNFYKNNSLQSNNYTGLTEDFWMPSFASRNGSMVVNFGQDGSFAGNKTAQGNADGNGYGDFYYAPPSGYLALCTQNLATELSPTIDDGSQYFNSLIYTGDGNNGRTVTGLGFQSDWTWIKSRNRGDVDHILNDSTRGAGKNIYSNDNYSEVIFLLMVVQIPM